MAAAVFGVLCVALTGLAGGATNDKVGSYTPTRPAALTPSQPLVTLPPQHAQTSAARLRRSTSRSAYADLGATQALNVLKRKASMIVDRRAWRAPPMPKGAQAVRYQRDERLASLTSATGRRLLVSSTLPLRKKDPDTAAMAPVNLGLERNAQGFETVNSFVDVQFPDELSDGLKIGGLRLHIGDSDDASAPAAKLGDTIAWTNAMTDTDVVADAVPQGAEITVTLRSAESPEDVPVTLDLPDGLTARLAAFDDTNRGGLAIVDRDQREVGTVSAPIAWDAEHVAVSSEWRQVDGRLVLHATHAGKDVAYPIVVDPVIYYGALGADLVAMGQRGTPWSWQDDTIPHVDMGYGAGWMGTGFHQGIDLASTTRHYTTGGAYWSLSLAGRQARITEFQLGNMAHGVGTGATGNVLGTCTFMRVVTPSGGGDFGGQVNRCDAYSSWSIDLGDYTNNQGTIGNTAQVGIYPAQFGDYRFFQQFIGALGVVLEDNTTPGVPTVTGGASNWTNAASIPITITAADAGLGVRAVGVRNDGGGVAWQTVSASDPQCVVCPTSATRTIPLTALSDGSHSLTASTLDQWNATGPFSASLPARIDRTAPTIDTLTGSLYDDRATSFSGARAIRVPVSGEGSTTTSAERRSGVKRIQLLVDGSITADQKDFVQQDSWVPSGAANVLRIDASSLSPGTHTVTVSVSDWAGNSRVTPTPFTITTAAATGTTVGPTDVSKFGDVDGNGTDDLVTMTGAGVAKVFPSAGLNGFQAGTTWATWTGATDVAMGDFDADGDADIIGRTSPETNLRVAQSSGTAFAAPAIWLASAPAGTLLAGDVNAAGGDDIVIVQSTGTVQVAPSNGTAFTSLGPWATVPAGSLPLIGDVSGDGRADLVLSRAGRIEVRKSDGATFGTAQDWGAVPAGDLQVADADGDHTDDLLVRGSDGIVRYLPSSGSSFGTSARMTVLPTSYAFNAADINGDHHADAVGRSAGEVSVRIGIAPSPAPPVPGTPPAPDPPVGSGPPPIVVGSLFPPLLGRDGFGDYTGDGIADHVTFRQAEAKWYVYPNPIGTQWGLTTDIPVPGDYDGDGKTDFATFRQADATWNVYPSTNPIRWGLAGDVPVPGDYNGDGKIDPAVYRPSEAKWFVYPNPVGFQFGLTTDVPVPGGYSGEGKTQFALFRQADAKWFVYPTATGRQWGLTTDIPVSGGMRAAPPTDWKYGGLDRRVTNNDDAIRVRDAFNAAPTDADALAILAGLYPSEVPFVESGLKSTIHDGDILLNISPGPTQSFYYNYSNGQVRKLPYAFGQALGADMAGAKRMTIGVLAGFSVGPEIGNYSSSWSYGGTNRMVDNAAEIQSVVDALTTLPDATGNAVWAGLSPADQQVMMESEGLGEANPDWSVDITDSDFRAVTRAMLQAPGGLSPPRVWSPELCDDAYLASAGHTAQACSKEGCDLMRALGGDPPCDSNDRPINPQWWKDRVTKNSSNVEKKRARDALRSTLGSPTADRDGATFGWAAHHIVAAYHPRAIWTRIMMTKCQIHPNSLNNGIYLRGPTRYSSSPGFDRLFPGQQQVALHRSPFVHTKEYYEAVNARVFQAIRGTGCDSNQARSELGIIKATLQSGGVVPMP